MMKNHGCYLKKNVMNNISFISDCYGCGVCAAACPKRIISIELNFDGFYEPKLEDDTACVDCGMCLEVCSFNGGGLSNGTSNPIACYAAWSNDNQVRQTCSSGGAGFEIARSLLGKRINMVGVKYDSTTNKAVHFIARHADEAMASMGSKYIQSYTLDAFKQINRKEKYLVTGTPCQIDSFCRYIKKMRCEDNFILMDFFCHGVPSMNLWKKYCREIEKITGEITEVSWRNKTYGWHGSWDMNIHGKKREELIDWHDSYNLLIRGKKTFISSRWSQGDLFFKMFLSNSCLGKACYERCKFKGCGSSADIRIGDFWGNTYKDDDKGVSSVVAFTDRGMSILKETNCHLVKHPYEVVSEGQLSAHIKEPHTRKLVCWLLTTKLPLKWIFIFVQVTRLPFLIKCKIQKIRKR